MPIGANRTLTLEGLNGDGDVLYYSQTTGITVSEDAPASVVANLVFVGPGGGLDLDFNGKGFVTENEIELGGVMADEIGNAVAIGDNDSIFIAGGQGNGVALWSLTADGTAGFGGDFSNGYSVNLQAVANDLALDNSGGFFVTGVSGDPGGSIGTLLFLSRHSQSDGEWINGFGGAVGRVIIN